MYKCFNVIIICITNKDQSVGALMGEVYKNRSVHVCRQVNTSISMYLFMHNKSKNSHTSHQ